MVESVPPGTPVPPGDEKSRPPAVPPMDEPAEEVLPPSQLKGR
jgi:hypothetical protein